MNDKPRCPLHGTPMTVLLYSSVCDICDPPKSAKKETKEWTVKTVSYVMDADFGQKVRPALPTEHSQVIGFFRASVATGQDQEGRLHFCLDTGHNFVPYYLRLRKPALNVVLFNERDREVRKMQIPFWSKGQVAEAMRHVLEVQWGAAWVDSVKGDLWKSMDHVWSFNGWR